MSATLERLRDVRGCGRATRGDVVPHISALWGIHDDCDACAALLVAAIAAPVERETIERCATVVDQQSSRFGFSVAYYRAVSAIYALPPRYGENPKEGP